MFAPVMIASISHSVPAPPPAYTSVAPQGSSLELNYMITMTRHLRLLLWPLRPLFSPSAAHFVPTAPRRSRPLRAPQQRRISLYLYSASNNAYTASTPCTGRITTRRAQRFSRLSTACIIGAWSGGDAEGPGSSSETFPSHAGGLYIACHPKYRLAAPASCAALACHSDGVLTGYNLERLPPPLIISSHSPPASTPSTSLITPPSCRRLSRLSRPIAPA
ncbi:hypothetical protein DFH09DRAFT_1340031 [Mycena vulgaris]|nr:hypothetical protein DFH09DRAFT_1340031 [Mycena vulgaris]